MRKLTILAVALAALLAPRAADAQVTLGARLGYAIAGGDEVKGSKLSEVIGSAIPVQLEVGYNLNPNLNVGAYFSYGWGSEATALKDGCTFVGASTCDVTVQRFGVQGTYGFVGSSAWVPWVGLGIGYEWLKVSLSGGGQAVTATEKGWEFANLQGGADYKFGKMLVGPFLSYSFGQYGSISAEGGGQSQSADITDKGTHTYLTIGVRGTFGL